jgi:hypothetical protein
VTLLDVTLNGMVRGPRAGFQDQGDDTPTDFRHIAERPGRLDKPAHG